MSQFTITRLADASALISGTDVRGKYGEYVVSTKQWDRIKAKDLATEAAALVDDAIEALVAPVMTAIEQAKVLTTAPDLDPLLYITEQDAVEHVNGQRAVVTYLAPDTIVLRAIEAGETDRLIWIDNRLVLTAAPAPAVAEVSTPSGTSDSE